MKEHGVRLVALNDTNNRIGDGVRDDFAEWEHEQIAERTRNGKRSKAREGKVVGGHVRAYGYDWVRDGKGRTVGYEVNEPEMHLVRRIFGDVARGVGIRTVKEKLDTERVPTPGGGMAWSRPFLRALVLDDLYRPHTVEELSAAGVSEAVLATLDADNVYGVYRFDGIPVPVPDAGVPREVMEAARYKVLNNRSSSRSGNRFWELSGGILRCAECGRAMQSLTVSGKRRHYYYRCQSTQNGSADRCTMRKNVRADVMEAEVWSIVGRLLDDKEYLLQNMRDFFEDRRRELSASGMHAEALARRLDQIERSWVKYQRAYDTEAISLADLKARRAELEGEREAVERELERTRNREAELERLSETETEMRERIQGSYGGLHDASPQKRRKIYEDLRLRVEVGSDSRPLLSGWFPIGSGIKAYAEGPVPRYLFNAERPPRHHVSGSETPSWLPSTPTTPPLR